MWTTKMRTILIQKGKEKGKAASNYRPITCLSLVWKFFNRCNFGRSLWIFGCKFVITSRIKRIQEQI